MRDSVTVYRRSPSDLWHAVAEVGEHTLRLLCEDTVRWLTHHDFLSQPDERQGIYFGLQRDHSELCPTCWRLLEGNE